MNYDSNEDLDQLRSKYVVGRMMLLMIAALISYGQLTGIIIQNDNHVFIREKK